MSKSIRCVLSEAINRNGRISKETVARFRERAVKDGVFIEFGAPRHDQMAQCEERYDRMSHVDQTRVCGKIVDVELDGDKLYGTIVPTGPMKSFMDSVVKGKSTPTFSMRSMVHKNNEHELLTFDLTGLR